MHLHGSGSVYPDFTLYFPASGREVILEHFGMMDDPDYAGRAVKKLRSFTSCGFVQGDNLFCSFETKHTPLDKAMALALIKSIKAANE